MKIVDEALLDEFRSARKCEFCRERTPRGADPAHIFSRGAGRVDIRENLVALCRNCHLENHAGKMPGRSALLAIAAMREVTTADAITEKVYWIRRTRK